MSSSQSVSLPKPFLFTHTKTASQEVRYVKKSKVSAATIKRGVEIIREAKKIREDAQKQEELTHAAVLL